MRAQLEAAQATIGATAEAAVHKDEDSAKATAHAEQVEGELRSVCAQLQERDVEVQVLLASGEQAQQALAVHKVSIEALDREKRTLVQEKREMLEARQRQLIQATVRIFLNRALSYSFRGWRDRVARFCSLRRVFARCGAFFRINIVATAFATWADSWAAQRLLIRAVRKLNYFGIAKAFSTWSQQVVIQTITGLRHELGEAEKLNANVARTASLQSHKDSVVADEIECRAAMLEERVRVAEATASELALKHEQALQDMQLMRTRIDNEHEVRIEQLTLKFLADAALGSNSLQLNRIRKIQGCVHAWASAVKFARAENQVRRTERRLVDARRKYSVRMDLVIGRASRQTLQMLGFMAWKQGLAEVRIAVIEGQIKAEAETRRAVGTVERHAKHEELERLRHELWERKSVASTEGEARLASEATIRTLQLKEERFLQHQSAVRPHVLLRHAVMAWHIHICKHAFAINSATWASEKQRRREGEVERMVRIAMRRACAACARTAYEGWAMSVARLQEERAVTSSSWTAQTQAELLAAVESSSRATLEELKRAGSPKEQSLHTEALLARLDEQNRITMAGLQSEHELAHSNVQRELAAAQLDLEKATTVADSALMELERLSDKQTAAVSRILERMQARNLRVLVHNAFGAWVEWDVAARTMQLRIVRLLDGRKWRIASTLLHSWQLTAHQGAANQRKASKICQRKLSGFKRQAWARWLQCHARSVRAPSLMVAALRLRKSLLKGMSFASWLGHSSRALAKREVRRTRLVKALRILKRSHVGRMFHGWKAQYFATINDRKEAFLRKEYGERRALVVAQEAHRTGLIDDLLEKCIVQTLRVQLQRAFRMWVGSLRRERQLRTTQRAAILRLQRTCMGETFRQWLVFHGMACTKGFREHAEHADNLEAENEALLLERDVLVERIEDLESMLNKTGIALSTVAEQHSRVLEAEWSGESRTLGLINEGLPPDSNGSFVSMEAGAEVYQRVHALREDTRSAEADVERRVQERCDVGGVNKGSVNDQQGDDIRSLLSEIKRDSELLRRQVGIRHSPPHPTTTDFSPRSYAGGAGFRTDGRTASVVSGRSVGDIEAAIASSVCLSL